MKKEISILLVLTTYLLNCQTTDAAGKKQGYWKKKDEKTNRLVYEGEFKDDLPKGKFKYYYPNDSVRAIMMFKDGGKTAYARLFHLNGKRMAEGKYINKEIRDSTWTFYDEAGILISKEIFLAGKKNGPTFIYFPDGTISEERNYKNDLQEGPFKQYFDAKKMRAQGNYLNGQLEGRVVYFFPNGTEAAAGYYKNGQKTGPWIYKSKDGKITDKELYTNGVLAGKKETEEFFLKAKTPVEPQKPAPQKTDTKKKNSQK